MYYETAANDHGLPHDPFLSCVVPRAIGWVTTCDREGRTNLAPFSFFNGVGTCPPQVMFSTVGAHADGGLKDSCANAETTGEFVINMATWALREEMNLTSAYVDRGVDEAELAGLDMAPSRLVAPRRVKRSPHPSGVPIFDERAPAGDGPGGPRPPSCSARSSVFTSRTMY